MRIGVNPITWSNDDLPELGGDIPLDVCLAEAKAAGYDGIELGCKFPRDAAVLGPLLERHGLTLVSGWYGTRLLDRSVEEELALMAPHQRLLETLGATVTIVAEVSGAVHPERGTSLADRPVLDSAQEGRLHEGLAAIAVRVPIVYHHHMGTVVETEAEIVRLLENTPDAVRLAFDTGHFVYAGGDPLRFVERWAHRIGHVHLKDVRLDVLAKSFAERRSFLDAVVDGVFTVPGDGGLDFAAILSRLVRAGYDGWLVVEAEQDPAKANPCQFARMGRTNVSRLLESLGVE